MKVKKPILLIQDNFGGLDQNQGQNPIVHCRFVGFPPLFWAKNASKSLKMPMFPYKMDTLYVYTLSFLEILSKCQQGSIQKCQQTNVQQGSHEGIKIQLLSITFILLSCDSN